MIKSLKEKLIFFIFNWRWNILKIQNLMFKRTIQSIRYKVLKNAQTQANKTQAVLETISKTNCSLLSTSFGRLFSNRDSITDYD